MLGRDDLVLCSATVLRASFAEKARAAVAGGFSAVSLWVADHERARAQGLSDADLRSLLADHGLRVAELDPVLHWLPAGDSAGALARSRQEEERIYAIARGVGARSLNAIEIFGNRLPAERAAEAFAGLCDRAAEHGLLVHLEFLPWTGIPDLASAWEIVRLADRRNGGLMLDSWHYARSGRPAGLLRQLPGHKVLAVQLSDAPRQAEENLVDETMHRRLLPGDGDADVAGFVRLLDEIGAKAPIGVEVISDALAALPPEEAARRAGNATRAVLARAREATRPLRTRNGGA